MKVDGHKNSKRTGRERKDGNVIRKRSWKRKPDGLWARRFILIKRLVLFLSSSFFWAFWQFFPTENWSFQLKILQLKYFQLNDFSNYTHAVKSFWPKTFLVKIFDPWTFYGTLRMFSNEQYSSKILKSKDCKKNFPFFNSCVVWCFWNWHICLHIGIRKLVFTTQGGSKNKIKNKLINKNYLMNYFYW